MRTTRARSSGGFLAARRRSITESSDSPSSHSRAMNGTNGCFEVSNVPSRHEWVLRGLERTHVERTHDARNQRGEPKQHLAFFLKFLQERLPLFGRKGARNLEALEGDRGFEALVVSPIHHAEAPLGNDALHSEHGRLERADDPED